MTDTKLCAACQHDLPLSEFWKAQSYCKDCSKTKRNAWNVAHPEKRRAQKQRDYTTHQANYKARHDAWAGRNPEKRREIRREWNKRNRAYCQESYKRYMARRNGNHTERVSYRAIWERGQGICHLCLLSVTREDCHFDHVIPLSKGGAHSMENIKVSHSKCNLHKSNKLPEELWHLSYGPATSPTNP